MIKFTLDKNGTQIIGIGLHQMNIKKLRQGKPIVVNLKEMGFTFDCELFIFSGSSDKVMDNEIKQFIGPNTILKPIK